MGSVALTIGATQTDGCFRLPCTRLAVEADVYASRVPYVWPILNRSGDHRRVIGLINLATDTS